MIGSIRGKVISVEGFMVLVETSSGIGYEVEVPSHLLSALKVGNECFLFTHHVVREDAELLYGFDSRESRLLFREIIKITGVGPRIGMAILSTFDLESFITAINQERVNALVATPGIGKKTAERIIVEMRDRISKLRIIEQIASPVSSNLGIDESEIEKTVETNKNNGALYCDEAVGALMSLGYKENIALNAVKAVYKDGMETDVIIVQALSHITKR